MKKIFLLSFLVIYPHVTSAQFFGQIPIVTKYNASMVVDTNYGIKMYEKLNFSIGGDSVRNDKKGYACQGWVQDIYESGSILHKGYYEDGHLTNYKNFYENGMLERSFKPVGFKKFGMEIFYSDGKIKSTITYYDGMPQIWIDYYANGQLEYLEESSKKMEMLLMRKSYLMDGTPQELFEIVDAKKRLYSKKEYYENGIIKAEGNMLYNPSVLDYQRNGVWKYYDTNGIIIEENWVNGERLK